MKTSCLAIATAILLLAPRARAQDADACIAASESALSLKKAGKLIDARKALATCAAPACPDPVKTSCQQRLLDVDRAVPSIAFAVKDAAGNDVPAVKITMDGQPLADSSAGAAITLDPGEHTFTFEASGQVVKRTVVIVEGVKARSEVVSLETPHASATSTAAPQPPATSEPRGDGQRTVGLWVGGAGIAGLAVGSVFGVMAAMTWNTAQNDQSNNEEHTASTYATVSTVAFVAGGVALATGAVVWLTAPRSSPSSTSAALVPTVETGGGGLSIVGQF
jgi:hypothetical protein